MEDHIHVEEGIPCIVIIAEYTKDGELNTYRIETTHDETKYSLEDFIYTQLQEHKSDIAYHMDLEYVEDLDDLGFLYDCEVIYLNQNIKTK